MPSLTGFPGFSSLHFFKFACMKRLYALGARFVLGLSENIHELNDASIDGEDKPSFDLVLARLVAALVLVSRFTIQRQRDKRNIGMLSTDQ